MELSVPISKIIHESIEIAVQTQLRCLVKDIANTLGELPGPLLKSISDIKNVSYYSYSEPGDDDIDFEHNRCQHLIITNEKYLIPCNEPLVWSKGSTACLKHSIKSSPYKKEGALPILNRISGQLVDKKTGYVYNNDGEIIGRYYGDKIILFEVS
jgi:hypothetical protein